MDDERLRRARREFIREHHPDRGGDAAEFLAGLRRFEAAPPVAEDPARVVVVADQPWPVSAVTRALHRLRRRRRSRVR